MGNVAVTSSILGCSVNVSDKNSFKTFKIKHQSLRKKCPYIRGYSGPHFPAFGTEYGEIVNTGKCQPE